MQPDDLRHSRFGLILLAAGGSSRLGSPKQLVSFEGRSLLRHAAETAIASGASPIVVVLGAGAHHLQSELDGLALEMVLNDLWKEGMSSSIRAGIVSAIQSPISAVILMLCDQPIVTSDTLLNLMAEFDATGKPVVVSEYDDATLGAPCVFARSLFPFLMQLRGPQGAKRVWRDLVESQIARVPFRLGLFDIDTPEDVARLEG